MQVNDSVDAILGAEVNDAVKMLQPLLLEDTGVHVVFKVAVVDGEANAIEPKRSEELGILLGEEVLEELESVGVAERLSLTLSKKYSYFSCPSTFLRAARTWYSWPGYPVMKFSMFTYLSISMLWK
jgi:hypothetical protein